MTIDTWKLFSEFCIYEKLTGGPDPHMKAVLKMCEGHPVEEQLWRSALYVGVYNVPSAEAIWRHWNFEHHPPVKWIQDNWKGLRFRRERKSVGLDDTGYNLVEYFAGARKTIDSQEMLKSADFNQVWKFANGLPHVGRYAATKLVELWYELGVTSAPHHDIRAKGGWSPRTMLQMLYPESKHNPYDNAQVVQAEELATFNYQRLVDAGIHISKFEHEVLLCEAKASISSKRQYPGRSLDSELKYEYAIKDYWNFGETEHMKVRPLISPEWSLGELQGWSDTRKELGYVASKHGYTWSDSLFDFNVTLKTGDFANPVRKAS